MIIISIVSGMFFISIDNQKSGWLIFGLVIGLVISQCLVEVIYAYDIKKVFAHKKTFGLGVGCVLLITLTFWLDIFGYERFEPSSDQISVLEISPGSFEGTYEYVLEKPFADNNFQNTPEIYDVIRKAKENMKEYDSIFDTDEEEYSSTIQFSVHYKMKNGADRYRAYWVKRGDITKELKLLYAQESFKKTQYAILDRSTEIEREIQVYDYNGELNIRASKEDKKKLLEAFKQDIIDTSYEDKVNTAPFGSMNIEVPESPLALEYGGPYFEYYTLYPFYKNTLKQLKSLGYDIKTQIDPEDVTEIQVDEYEKWIESAEASDKAQTYTKPDQIEEIMKSSIGLETEAYNLPVDDELIITMYYKDDLGNEKEESFHFKQDATPDFVKTDFGK
jgi:ABC-2 type transport system permease protein